MFRRHGMSMWIEGLVQLLISRRGWLLFLAVVLAVGAFWPAGQVSFDRSIENMFAADDPLLAPYRKLRRVFGGNELVLAVFEDPQLLDPDGTGIRRLAGIRRRLEQVPGVRSVLTLDRPIGELIVRSDSQLAARTRELFEDYTHGADGRTVAAVCMLEPEDEAQIPRRQTIEQLGRIVADLPDGLTPGVLAGEPVMVEDGFRHVEQDGRRLSVWSTLLLSLTIVLCFRSLRWLIVPAAVVQLTLLMTRATLVLTGLRLSMVSSMLTAIVTVVGVATVVHVIVRFQEGRDCGLSPEQALARAARLLAVPICWACATDAVGFASLTFSRVGPVRDFGVMMAIGSLLVPISVALVVPALSLWGRRESAAPPSRRGEGLGLGLARVNQWVQARPATVASLSLASAVLAVLGILRLEVETDFTRNFRSDSSVVRSYRFVEENLGGAGVWDVILPAPRNLDWDYVQRVRRLESRLRDEVVVDQPGGRSGPGLTKVLSLVDAVTATTNLEQVDPFLRDGVLQAGLLAMRGTMPAFSAALYSRGRGDSQESYLRIMLRARERQAADQKRLLIDQVTQICRQEFPSQRDGAGAEVTGFFVLLASLISSLIRDQWLTFGIATGGIAAMLTVAFRSVRYSVVALVPNALPIVLVLGAMGWLGFRVNMGAAMIAAVSMGLSVDSSIHYITFFRRLREQGNSAAQAIGEAQQTVGRAVVYSTLALMVGFTVLCTSQFVPTIYFGMLVSLSMLGGLLGNLVLLPLLLRIVER